MVRSFNVTKKERLKMLDPIIIICTVILSSMSIITLIGGYGEFPDLTKSNIVIQLGSTVVGIAAMMILSMLDYEEIVEKLYGAFFIISVALLLVTLLFGTSMGTNLSYLRIGPVGIQPSEFVKASYILTFSRHLGYAKEKINSLKTLLGLALHAGIIIGLVLISGDLGVALVYIGITAIMLFCAGLSIWYFIGAIVAVGLAFPYIWDMLDYYQQQRIIVGFNPDLDPTYWGYQATWGRRAVANGGFWGRGMFGGDFYQITPHSETDFIFSTYCEKFGLVGGVLFFVVMAILVIRILFIAAGARKSYGRFICIGAAAALILQTLENAGMCMGFLPVVGITLPFMSYGGSSMLALFILMGMVQSVRSHHDKYFFALGREE